MASNRRLTAVAGRVEEFGWSALRPVLRLRLAYFRHVIRTGTFPPRRPDAMTCAADHVGYLGSAAAARFGVLDDDLTTLSRVASQVGALRGRPFAWIEVAPGVLTVHDAAESSSSLAEADVDAVVVALGFSDVLLMTSARAWQRDLDRLLDHARRPGRGLSPVIVAGIPPMHRFAQTARLGRGRIRRQVARLDAATRTVVGRRGDCVFVPFPDPDGPARVGPEFYSWAQVHKSWASALAPELARLLDTHA
ncbi:MULTISPECIES: hypothetical protein [unclassified Frigoribacterium]|uniref:hypothetical protein n=1 Tax=unclassified Frigoribacterium TaxID=2627005 RepID=UPI0006FD66A0|nr:MULTISPECIES: hypothetical protein [unclassified Frigoribacterium]KQO46258.1 hypothetical protein ASF07_00280 [Frigoribacterium sp. Leaf254]KQT38350.1 hypothetical protein ASG28_00280 [Frigoribacterium sp. Leaf415]